ncbi:hypothetical protein D3C75_1374680 [compost metagenome]
MNERLFSFAGIESIWFLGAPWFAAILLAPVAMFCLLHVSVFICKDARDVFVHRSNIFS